MLNSRMRALIVGIVVLTTACSPENRRSEEDVRRIAELEAEVKYLRESADSAAPAPSPARDPAPAATNCARARVEAHDAWARAEIVAKADLDAAVRAVRKAEGPFLAAWDRNRESGGGVEEMRASREKQALDVVSAVANSAGWLLNRIVAAKRATSEGALKLRDAARAVGRNKRDTRLAEAEAASEAAFNACKDVAP